MSSFDGLYIGLSALRSQQTVQEVVSHNVANANTPGYSRCDAVLVTLPPTKTGGAAISGQGVEVSTVHRSVSTLLNTHIQQETGVLSEWEVRRDGSDEVQRLFNEPGQDGIHGALEEFWDAWRNLSVDATSIPLRANVLQAGDRLATNLRSASQGLANYMAGLDEELKIQLDHLNVLSAEVASLNKQIVQAVANGNEANDLRDRRDVVLEQISQITQIKTGENADGSVSIAIGGHLLVGGAGAAEVKAELSSEGVWQPVWQDDGAVMVPSSGRLSALADQRNWVQTEVQTELNTLAVELMDQVNTLHTGAYDKTGTQGAAFFVGNTAADIRVNPDIAGLPAKVAVAASTDALADGSVALALAKLAQTEVPALSGSINDAYATLVGKVGLRAGKADQMATQQDALVSFLKGRREEISGVSLDEEAVRMLGAQRAYQAASRVITAVDQMLDKLINETGLVGR